jgi:hypothetical protein
VILKTGEKIRVTFIETVATVRPGEDGVMHASSSEETTVLDEDVTIRSRTKSRAKSRAKSGTKSDE